MQQRLRLTLAEAWPQETARLMGDGAYCVATCMFAVYWLLLAKTSAAAGRFLANSARNMSTSTASVRQGALRSACAGLVDQSLVLQI